MRNSLWFSGDADLLCMKQRVTGVNISCFAPLALGCHQGQQSTGSDLLPKEWHSYHISFDCFFRMKCFDSRVCRSRDATVGTKVKCGCSSNSSVPTAFIWVGQGCSAWMFWRRWWAKKGSCAQVLLLSGKCLLLVFAISRKFCLLRDGNCRTVVLGRNYM